MQEPTPPNWEDELSPEELERFRQLDPARLMDALREDVALAVAIVRADTRPSLRAWFSEGEGGQGTGGWEFEEERTGPIGPSTVGVEWHWFGVHNDANRDPGAFNGIPASGRDVKVHGFSLLGVEDERLVVRRYVDWAGLFAQLGLTLNWRTPVSPDAVPADAES